jgi:hypothetical protein
MRIKKIEIKLMVEVEESKKELQKLVNALATKSLRLEEENKNMHHRLGIAEKNDDFKRHIQSTEEKVAGLRSWSTKL